MKIDVSKYESMQQFADDFPEQKELLKAFQSLDSKLRFDKLHCAVCDCELTKEDKAHTTHMDFNFVCLKHREAAQVFQIDVWMKQNNIQPIHKSRFSIQ